ncbi:MAG: ISAs1 family transposase [Candidatus Sulfotelmatobacter sp.]
MQVDTEEILEISRHFGKLEDPRSHVNRKHLLGDLIVICICGVLSGCDGPIAIGQWADDKAVWLKEHLALPNGIPSHDTIGRLLMALQPAGFQACFTSWIEAILKARESTLREEAEDPSLVEKRHIAIDGKTPRRSHDHRKELGPMHLVSAWAVDCGLSLGQLATAEKSNEITAIPQLMDQIQIKNSIITIDAAGCQREIAAKIVDGHGDYCLALKGNQGNLQEAARTWVEEQMRTDFTDCRVETFESQEKKKHGREEHYTYYQFDVPNDFPGREKWKKLRTIGVAIRFSKCGDKQTDEVRYYITSLPLNVKLFAKSVRGHWAIENTLHWCLDVTFREDDSRVRERTLTNNMAWLKRFAISLLKQVPDKLSVAMRRRSCGWNETYIAQVLFGSDR